MSKELVEIKGFPELKKLIQKLPDKVKRSEVQKILGQVANPTVKAAKEELGKGSGFININGKRYKRLRRQIGKTVIQDAYVPGYGQRTIAKATMRRAKNPMVVVSPRSRSGKDGYYLRQWIIPGTRFMKANPFIDRAYERTKGKVTPDAEKKVAAYIQKQINRLSNA